MSGSNSSSATRWKSWLGFLPSFSGKVRLITAAAAAQRLLGRSERKVCLWEGAEFWVDLRDRIQRQMWCGCYEPHVMGVLRRILRPGDTFVDLGAHIGYHPYFAAGLVGASGRVFSFEADPANFLRLKKNLEYFPQAAAKHCAIWAGEENLAVTRSESPKESGCGARPGLVLEMSEPLLGQAGTSALMIEELLRDEGYSLGRLSNDGLTPWKGVGQNESVDCVAIPECQETKEMKNWGLA